MLRVNRFLSSESDPFTRTDVTWKLPVTAINGAGSPSSLLDGDQGSYWTSHGDVDSVIVDLGASYTINYVNLAFYLGEDVTDTFDATRTRAGARA